MMLGALPAAAFLPMFIGSGLRRSRHATLIRCAAASSTEEPVRLRMHTRLYVIC
jgi:hypothetical protein